MAKRPDGMLSDGNFRCTLMYIRDVYCDIFTLLVDVVTGETNKV